MSKVTRLVLASLVSLGVIVGIYTRVEGASLSARQDGAGSHLVGGAQVNLDHYRSASPAPAAFPPDVPGGQGHGCESETQTSPED